MSDAKSYKINSKKLKRYIGETEDYFGMLGFSVERGLNRWKGPQTLSGIERWYTPLRNHITLNKFIKTYCTEEEK